MRNNQTIMTMLSGILVAIFILEATSTRAIPVGTGPNVEVQGEQDNDGLSLLPVQDTEERLQDKDMPPLLYAEAEGVLEDFLEYELEASSDGIEGEVSRRSGRKNGARGKKQRRRKRRRRRQRRKRRRRRMKKQRKKWKRRVRAFYRWYMEGRAQRRERKRKKAEEDGEGRRKKSKHPCL